MDKRHGPFYLKRFANCGEGPVSGEGFYSTWNEGSEPSRDSKYSAAGEDWEYKTPARSLSGSL